MWGGDLGTGRSPAAADAFPDGWGRIPDNPLIPALIAALCKGGPRARSLVGGWTTDDQDCPVYRHIEEDGAEILVSFDPDALSLDGDPLAPGCRWRMVESLCPLTIDVAVALLAQTPVQDTANAAQKSLGEPVRVSARSILDYKGLVQWGKRGAALRQRVDAEIRKLNSLRFVIRRPCARPRALVQRNTRTAADRMCRLFHAVETRTVRPKRKRSAGTAETSWSIRVGGQAGIGGGGRDQMGSMPLPQLIIRYDHRRNRGGAALAKKIGLTIWLLSARVGGKTAMRVRVRDLLENIGELPRRNVRGDGWASRMHARFGQALRILRDSAIVTTRANPPAWPAHENDRTRGWVGIWLGSWVVLDPIPSVDASRDFGPTFPKTGCRTGTVNRLLELHRGSVIRAMRADRKVSQCGLAREIGISAAYLSQIENGRRMPSQAVLGRIARWASRTVADGAGQSDGRGVVTTLELAAHNWQNAGDAARRTSKSEFQKLGGPQEPAGKGGCT